MAPRLCVRPRVRFAAFLLVVPSVVSVWLVRANGDIGAQHGVREHQPAASEPVKPPLHESHVPLDRSRSTELNLIVVTIDTLRADLLGHPRHVIPNLDALAASGAVFENAYAPASFTGRSVGPLLIGKYSSETGGDFSHFSSFANSKDIFIQQRLRAANVHTMSVQSYWYFYQPKYGFDRGFDIVDSKASSSPGYLPSDRTSNSEQLAGAVLAQLAQPENREKRFYLWAHFTDTHAEYVAHPGFDFGNTPKERYYGEAAFVDHNIGRIVEWVRRQPWGKNTVFIVTSDHGEAFGEHGMSGHGGELWEPLIRVPLIVNGAGIGVRRISTRRSIMDLVPTILDLMRVETPTGRDSDFVSGRSLLPEILGTETSRDRPVFADMAPGPFNPEREAYISQNLKLIAVRTQPLGLFDLSTDPEERRNLLKSSRNDTLITQYREFRQKLRAP